MEKNRYYMIGYTHIDPVWLWMQAEGMQEVKSSFSSALDRLDEFPDFKFTQTSIAFLGWLKENCPEQFERIRKQIEEGRWEIAGGMWVEPDCDLPSGESLIRHFLYGKGFVKDEFGKEVTECFNPDSFGHGANMPAILRGCGFRSYTVSRPSKEAVKLPPVFCWKSPDGSSVMAERTGGEYMAWTRPAIEFNLKESREQLAEIGYDKMAVFYGVGNHGGGPTIENIRAVYELREETEDAELDFAFLSDFYAEAEPEKLPVVTGELGRIFYGCYSSDRGIKQANRKAEWTLLKAETIASMAAHMGVSAYSYPKETLERAWKWTLFNQFHDVLAGTSIEPARNAAVREFGAAIAEAEHIIRDGIQAIANAADTRGDGFPLVLVNPTGTDFSGVFAANVYIPRALKKLLRLRDDKGAEIPYSFTDYQNSAVESRRGILFEAKVPAYGYAVYRVMHEGPNQENPFPIIHASENELDNGVIRIRIDEETGCPSSIQKAGKELLSVPAAVKVFYDDRGAWGAKVYEEKLLGTFRRVKSRVAEATPMRSIVRVFLEWERSEMRIDYILEKDSDVLKMDVRFHNMEKHRQINFCLPAAVGKPMVRTETAFLAENKIDCRDKNMEHYQHRFADISDAEEKCGIAVFNDSVYACEQKENEYRLILSRSTVHARGNDGPLPEDLDSAFMDQGVWDYQLWLLPHENEAENGRLFAQADRLHMPLEFLQDSNHTGQKWLASDRLFSMEQNHIAVSCVKQSLENPAELVVRAFETDGKEGSLRLTYGKKTVETIFSPYQIKTLRLTKNGFRECDLLEREVKEGGA